MNKLLNRLPDDQKAEAIDFIRQVSASPAMLAKSIRDTRAQLFSNPDLQERDKITAILTTMESIQKGGNGTLEDSPTAAIATLESVVNAMHTDPIAAWETARPKLITAAEQAEQRGDPEAGARIRSRIADRDVEVQRLIDNPDFAASQQQSQQERDNTMTQYAVDAEALKQRAEAVKSGKHFNEHGKVIDPEVSVNEHLQKFGKAPVGPDGLPPAA